MTDEEKMREALVTIRDSTFRSALQLRSIADRALQAIQPIPYALTEAGLAELETKK